jgi:tctex1 domain-containing protein 2
MVPSGLRSPSNPRSGAPSPRPTFDGDLLRAYMKKLLQTNLASAAWPPARERDRVKQWMKEIGERVKERMLGASFSSLPPVFHVLWRRLG